MFKKKKAVSDPGPIVYIHHDTSSFAALVSLTNLYRLLTCNWLLDAEKTGIPAEITEKVYDDYNDITIEYIPPAETMQVCCVSPAAHDGLHYIQEVMAALNLTNVFSLTIFSPYHSPEMLHEWANSNVRMLPPGTNYLQASLMITYGPGALHFLKAGMPVVIAGPYGFGGLITPANFHWFLENGFMGRPGGTHGEPVPHSIVLDELKECKEKHSSLLAPSLLHELKQLAMNLHMQPLSNIGCFKEQACLLHEQLHDPKNRWALKPRVATNISFVSGEENVYIRRLRTNTTLAVLKRQDQVFFKQVNGQRTCRQLMENTNLDEHQFWNYLYQLWEKKIILFHAV